MVAGLLHTVGLSGCQDASVEQPPSVSYPEIARYTVGEATDGLGADGRFRLKGPTGSDEISEDQAEALAAIWPRQFGTWVTPSLEMDHGASIVVENLRTCGTTYYVQSAFEPLPERLRAADPSRAGSLGIGGWSRSVDLATSLK